MSRSVFGWSLPPGVTQRMIDEQCESGPCACCGGDVDTDNCICIECPTCGSAGDPNCYKPTGKGGHGLKFNRSQVIGQTQLKIGLLQEQISDHQMYIAWLEEPEQEKLELAAGETGNFMPD